MLIFIWVDHLFVLTDKHKIFNEITTIVQNFGSLLSLSLGIFIWDLMWEQRNSKQYQVDDMFIRWVNVTPIFDKYEQNNQ